MTEYRNPNDVKRATPDHPVHELIAARWSPYAWADRPVAASDLHSLFEAARWAASAYNEQPWRYIVAARENDAEFGRLLSCLVEGNRGWAKSVPVLALGLIRTTFAHNDKPNPVALHDLGAASAQLTFEASARGLKVHQMSGILPDEARSLYGIPEEFEAVTALAIGYEAAPGKAPEELAERDMTPRPRRPIGEFLFEGKFGG